MDNQTTPGPLVVELALAAAVTPVLGGGLLLSLPRPWGDLISVAVSIAAGVAVLASRRIPSIVPISVVYIFVMFVLLVFVAFGIAGRRGF